MKNPLHGQTAIISGGLGDIGRAIALRLASLGADVAVGDVLPVSKSQPLLSQLSRLGVRARYDRVDVSDSKAVDRWVKTVERKLAVPTLIVSNAAIVKRGGIEKMTAADWSRELAVNLSGSFHLAQSAARRMISRRKPGRIVFIGSWAGHAPHPSITSYCVGKAGLRMLCQCMALELAPRGIQVNEVAPGYVDGGLSGNHFKNAANRRKGIRTIPLRRLTEPGEVALQVAHLCDPSNRQMTGTTLLMDGGLPLQLRMPG